MVTASFKLLLTLPPSSHWRLLSVCASYFQCCASSPRLTRTHELIHDVTSDIIQLITRHYTAIAGIPKCLEPKLSIVDRIVRIVGIIAYLRIHIHNSGRSKRTFPAQRNNRRLVPKTAPTLDFIGPDRLPPADPSHFGASPGLDHSLSDSMILVVVPG
jgi:hypothetical protein